MRIYLILLLACVCFGITSNAQSLYELKYHFDTKQGRDDYRALLLRNGDGTGVIRLEFYDRKTRKRNLYDMEMEESYGEENGKEDRNILIYVGLNPEKVIGNMDYSPDHFVFEYNKKTRFYEPSFVLSIHPDDSETIGELDEVRLLSDKDLTRDFLLKYYTEDDEEFHNFFDEAETRGLSTQQKQATLHLVLVANTNDKSIGNSCVVDKNATYNTFKEVAEFLGIQMKQTIISGETFSKKNVDLALTNLHPGPSDIVVFYYSGHGFNDVKRPTQFPFLDLRDKSYQMYGDEFAINIESVFNYIKGKGARLNLIISDCCNSDPSLTNKISTDGPTTRTSSIGWNMNNCKALFMNPQPVSLLITAAAKGELSAGNSNKGGIFTFNFRESLEKYLGPFANNVNWNDLVANARNQTINTASRTGCRQDDNTLRSCIQNPVFRMAK
jgi:hypothetical protein